MADRLTKRQRSRLMSRIRGKGTKPELVVALNLRACGIRFRRHADLPGRPDFLLPDLGVALFVHGCFWHACPSHFRAPASNVAFWAGKMARNRRRDRRVRRRLAALGIRSVVLWEHHIMV